MAYRPSKARYGGGGKVKYLVYRSAQPLRSGRTQERTRVKRLYFPANATDITIDRPGMHDKRTGTSVYGVAARYHARLSATTAHRGGRSYRVPERTAERVKIVELPRGATGVKLTDHPPEGPRMAVA